MEIRTSKFLSLALLFAGLLGAAVTANAQLYPNEVNPGYTIPGYAGHDPYNTNCFTETWGAVINNCASNESWEIALPVLYTYTQNPMFSAQVTFYAPSSSARPSCVLYAVNPYGASSGSVSIAAPSAGNSYANNTVTVPQSTSPPYNSDSLYLWCTIPQNAKVYSVFYGFDT